MAATPSRSSVCSTGGPAIASSMALAMASTDGAALSITVASPSFARRRPLGGWSEILGIGARTERTRARSNCTVVLTGRPGSSR